MAEETIKINDIELALHMGEPFSFEGPLAGRELAGIYLDFDVRGVQNREMIDNLFQQKCVQVEDPFSGQSYEADVFLRQSSYAQGSPIKHYMGEVRERDVAPSYDSVLIDGVQYPVLRSREEFREEEGISRHLLVRLNESQFAQVRRLILSAPIAVSIQRLGVDEKPFEAFCGGWLCWSKHQEEDSNQEPYYKQVLRLYSVNPEDKAPIFTSLLQRFEGIEEMTVATSVRLEALTNLLAQGETISEQQRQDLLEGDWRELVSKERIEVYSLRLYKVRDAEEEFLEER